MGRRRHSMIDNQIRNYLCTSAQRQLNSKSGQIKYSDLMQRANNKFNTNLTLAQVSGCIGRNVFQLG